jgi:hypothetical protein
LLPFDLAHRRRRDTERLVDDPDVLEKPCGLGRVPVAEIFQFLWVRLEGYEDDFTALAAEARLLAFEPDRAAVLARLVALGEVRLDLT